MKVSLIEHTPNPDYVAAFSARVCYSTNPNDLKLDEKSIKKLLRRVIKSGHHSVLEHVNFTFLIEGISRVATHQLVRHRIASYSQQSHRYTKIEKDSFVIPPSIENMPHIKEIYDQFIRNSLEFYNRLIELGVKKEDARFVIPQAASSNIVVSMNARELLHFFSLRCCVRAQWEIREAAIEMLKITKSKAPIIFENAGPACVRGRCPEEKPCPNISEIRHFFKNL
ncbi:FAD-dependent thymidylate synthase [Hippea maritima]|uniref:Flavin-dependent thymidylate synthase n=1 Tax=Hippea maritima (strain ATCC 700847 / DSM 10411 / MH2) TaxID=760142 RepID=F2LVJ7_HIPMA|nr:FAD-dependent thymidylate synthase [Hippea maritima]AEA33781.1 Thymidylate synthase thyX [Hippea maritima DSM 10411]